MISAIGYAVNDDVLRITPVQNSSSNVEYTNAFVNNSYSSTDSLELYLLDRKLSKYIKTGTAAGAVDLVPQVQYMKLEFIENPVAGIYDRNILEKNSLGLIKQTTYVSPVPSDSQMGFSDTTIENIQEYEYGPSFRVSTGQGSVIQFGRTKFAVFDTDLPYHIIIETWHGL